MPRFSSIIGAAVVVSALLFGPALAQQEAPLSREQRIQVQVGLAVLGFDPGPADGLFGGKTRAAIEAWQEAKELEATGRLTPEQAEALAALGEEAEKEMERRGYERIGKATPERQERAEPEQSETGNEVPYFFDPPCDPELHKFDGCWVKVASHDDCHVFLQGPPHSRHVVDSAWSGRCFNKTVHGEGTLVTDYRWMVGPANEKWARQAREEAQGEMVGGRMEGHWTIQSEFRDARAAPGAARSRLRMEGRYVDGARHGEWQSEATIAGSHLGVRRDVYAYENGRLVRFFDSDLDEWVPVN